MEETKRLDSESDSGEIIVDDEAMHEDEDEVWMLNGREHRPRPMFNTDKGPYTADELQNGISPGLDYAFGHSQNPI